MRQSCGRLFGYTAFDRSQQRRERSFQLCRCGLAYFCFLWFWRSFDRHLEGEGCLYDCFDDDNAHDANDTNNPDDSDNANDSDSCGLWHTCQRDDLG